MHMRPAETDEEDAAIINVLQSAALSKKPANLPAIRNMSSAASPRQAPSYISPLPASPSSSVRQADRKDLTATIGAPVPMNKKQEMLKQQCLRSMDLKTFQTISKFFKVGMRVVFLNAVVMFIQGTPRRAHRPPQDQAGRLL
jgi:hypothetical protein